MALGHHVELDSARRPQHKASEGADESWRIVQAAGHLELAKAKLGGFCACLVIDLAQSLDVVGDEGDGHDADVPHLFGSQVAQGAMQGRLQPFAGADLALIAEAMPVGPTAAGSAAGKDRLYR